MKRILVIPLALIALTLTLCSCQRVGLSSTAYPPITTPEATVSPVTEDELSVSIDNKPAFTSESEDLPVLMANGSETTGFRTTNIDEFEMLMIDRADVRQKFGIPLFYYLLYISGIMTRN